MEQVIMQSLWIGEELSIMESMCINSFLKNGYKYHLYTYNHVKNVPIGTILKDANEILDKSEIFTYKNKSYSAISNRFRFELLYKKGNMWVDTDVVSIKKYNFTEDDKYIIFTESNKKYNEEKIGACILKFPKGDPILLDAIEICKQKKEEILDGKIMWGIGPSTVNEIVKKYSLYKYLKPWRFANSCSCHHALSITDPNFKSRDPQKYITNLKDLSDETYFIHLWHELWRRNNIDKNGFFPENSLFKQLINKFKAEKTLDDEICEAFVYDFI